MTRVIGARELEELAIGASLAVPADAIITPLAMDVIREKRLRLERIDAEAEVASRRRAEELEAAEMALNEAPSPPSPMLQAQTAIVEERQREPNMDEERIAAVVEATVNRILGNSVLSATESPQAIKFATFGPDGAALLRAVSEEADRCGAAIERLSGRAVNGLFVLAGAVSSAKPGEARQRLEQGLSSRRLPIVFEI